MAAVATASSSGGIRYAPEDPTLPKPWKGLVDGKTGYVYFWNPETNVTQYERPVSSAHASSAPSHKSMSSSVQVQRYSQGQRHDNSSHDDDDKYRRDSNGGSMRVTSGAGSSQISRTVSDHSLIGAAKGYVSSGNGSGLSADSYRRRHEITVIGDNVPQPFTSFEATGFPSEILREVRYLLQAGAKCRTLCFPLLGACMFVERPFMLDQSL